MLSTRVTMFYIRSSDCSFYTWKFVSFLPTSPCFPHPPSPWQPLFYSVFLIFPFCYFVFQVSTYKLGAAVFVFLCLVKVFLYIFVYLYLFYWLCYYSWPSFSPLSHSPQYSPFPLATPPFRLCPWVLHISSLAAPFPILFLTCPCLFCTYQFVLLNPHTFSLILLIPLPNDLHIYDSVSVLLVCLVCFFRFNCW